VLLVTLKPSIHVNNIQHVIEHLALHDIVLLGVCGETWASVNLYQPRLEGVVDHDVVPVQFEAVLVVDHYVADRQEGSDDDHLDLRRGLLVVI